MVITQAAKAGNCVNYWQKTGFNLKANTFKCKADSKTFRVVSKVRV